MSWGVGVCSLELWVRGGGGVLGLKVCRMEEPSCSGCISDGYKNGSQLDVRNKMMAMALSMAHSATVRISSRYAAM